MAEELSGSPHPVVVGPAQQPNGAREGPGLLVSILVPCCGQIEHTRLSVPRLLRHSRPPFELIFVDVASLDGTPDYLAGVAAAAPVRVEVVTAASEPAFWPAVNEGLSRARGAFVAWVNNDVLVPELWLNHLVALANSSPNIGVVGPMSNVAPQAQRVTPVPYRLSARRDGAEDWGGKLLDTEPVDRFAREHRDKRKGEWFEVDRLGGFCFLLKRDVLNRAPLTDDKGAPGVFDAEGWCLRVRRAGFRLAGCSDLFVHHFGSRVSVG